MPDARLLTQALAYLAHGWSLCPVYADHPTGKDKDPHHGMLSRTGYRDPDTRRTVWKPLQDTRPTEATVRTWLSEDGAGIALVTGTLSGVIVLDFDGDEGDTLLRELKLKPHVRTPSGGYHVRVAHPGFRVSTVAWKNTSSLPPGLDIRGDGGLCMLPPTWTKKGPYTALRDPYVFTDVSHLPAPVLRSIGLLPPEPKPQATVTPGPDVESGDRFPSDRILHKALEKLAGGEGRNNTGYWLARALHNTGYGYEEIVQIGRQYVDHVSDVNTKGQREEYTISEFSASARQVQKLTPDPWTSQRPSGNRQSGEKRARSATDELQDAWPSLTWAQREAAALILARNWRAHTPLEKTMTFLRLCGDINDGVRLAVRAAYREDVPAPGDDALRRVFWQASARLQHPQ